MKAATHKGHCQVCGRIQALPGSLLSKHGYTVDWGYFNGVCYGERKQPLEVSRKVCDEIIADLLERAKVCDEEVRGVMSGSITPKYAPTPFYWTVKNREGKHEPVVVLYADALYREQEIARSQMISRLEQTAKHMRSHAGSMSKLADTVHGKELMPVVDENRKEIVPGCKITTGGKQYTVVNVERRERMVGGWSRRGGLVWHASVQNSKGQTFWIPCGSIRQDKIEL